ncbi:melibiase [Odoribacter sp. Z80]|nr:melibiase [Odoribacter sp. Z80]
MRLFLFSMKPLCYLLFFLCVCSLVKGQHTYDLSNLNLQLMTSGYGQARADVASSGGPLTLEGKTYRGVGTHAESRIWVQLNGQGKRFKALVGVDDAAGGQGSVIFRVTGDGKELFNSGIMKWKDAPKKIDVRLKGIQKMMLEVLPTPDGINYDHADWAEAQIEMNSGKPLAVPDCELIEIPTRNLQLVVRVDKNKNVFQQYFGERGGLEKIFSAGVPTTPLYPTFFSCRDYTYRTEPALHVIHTDGHMNTVLKYENTKITQPDTGITLTRITLKDPNYDFRVDVCFQAYENTDVLEQWAEIYHNESAPVLLKNFASAALSLQSETYWLTQFTGNWAGECHLDEVPLMKGSRILESKAGITNSHGHQQHFILSLQEKSSENKGEVIMGSLAWSGNYKLQFEVNSQGNLIALAGINPWASDYTLEPGKRFITPRLVYTYSNTGKGEASRRLHRWAINHNLRDGHQPLRTIYNNWEATGMNTADKRIIPFLQPARDFGFELFLLDDGWFGLPNQARILGEWEPTPVMHPQGMTPLIREAGKTGIDFGLWVEMEMANPNARLVKEHPEWLLYEPNRTPYLQRGQYVLDLTNPAVRHFCIEAFDKILNDNPGISFVKWDCNSAFHNPYSHYLGKQQQHLWIDYTHGLYKIFSQAAERHPRVQMMLCSAGGARSDYGALKYFHEFWASDNTMPSDRVFIQWGYSHIFPAKAIGAHVTHMGRQPFKFAFDVAMSGCLGMDADPGKMSEEEKKITCRAVKTYKEKLRNIVQGGELYRLLSPYENTRAALMFVTPTPKNKAVVFVYQLKNDTTGCTIRPEGLDPEKIYHIEEVNIDTPAQATCQENGKSLSGQQLMTYGLSFNCKKRFDSAVIYLSDK